MRNRIRVFRAERRWSQAELAGRLKVSRQTINAIETDKYNPSLPLAFQIAKLFDQPIEAIFEPDAEAEDPEPERPAGFLVTRMAGKM
ncbi:MAG: helix-turn-helix transcriptional regulator [Steroidobacteraceae bacterium]